MSTKAYTLTQVKDNPSCAGTTCAVTVTSTGAGHLLGAGILNAANVTISGVSAAACTGSWTAATSAHQFGASSGNVDIWYCLNSASGQTSITVTSSGTNTGVAVIWEATPTAGNTIAVDSGATPSGGQVTASCAATCVGTSLTLSANSKMVFALATPGDTITAVVGTGWTADLAFPGGNAIAHGIFSTSGTLANPASWTHTAGNDVTMDAAAFQETGGSTTPGWIIPTVGPSWAICLLIGIMIGAGYEYMDHSIRSSRSVARNHTSQDQSILSAPVINLTPMADGSYQVPIHVERS